MALSELVPDSEQADLMALPGISATRLHPNNESD